MKTAQEVIIDMHIKAMKQGWTQEQVIEAAQRCVEKWPNTPEFRAEVQRLKASAAAKAAADAREAEQTARFARREARVLAALEAAWKQQDGVALTKAFQRLNRLRNDMRKAGYTRFHLDVKVGAFAEAESPRIFHAAGKAGYLPVLRVESCADEHSERDWVLHLEDGSALNADTKCTFGENVAVEVESHGTHGWVLRMAATSRLLVFRIGTQGAQVLLIDVGRLKAEDASGRPWYLRNAVPDRQGNRTRRNSEGASAWCAVSPYSLIHGGIAEDVTHLFSDGV